MSSEYIWVSWEDHRRSRELSSSLGIKFYPIVSESPRWKRYPFLITRTILMLLKKRPAVVFVQNPSIVLTSAVIFLRHIFQYKVIVDRHSNFKFEHENSRALRWRLFHFLSRYTLKNSDLTIVTNDPLKEICEHNKARAVVLQDRIPSMQKYDQEAVLPFFEGGNEVFNIMAVTTFNEDEPIDEIISAARRLPDQYRVYLTGNYRKRFSDDEKELLKKNGIIFTGFIDEANYQTLMFSADAVIVLTKKEFILNCGAYEAIAFGKPMILSNTDTIRGYFRFGAVYSLCSSDDIYNSILRVESEKFDLLDQVEFGRESLTRDWNNRFRAFKKELQEIGVKI